MPNLLKTLVNMVHVVQDHGSRDDSVSLLVKIIRSDLSVEEEVVVVARGDIQKTCDAFAEADNVAEVTVFQRIYHAKKQPVQPEATSDDAALLTSAALGVMKV